MNALEALSHTSHVIQTQTCSRHLSPTALQKQAVRDATVKGKQDQRLACQDLEESGPVHGPSSKMTLAMPKSRAVPLPMAFAVGGLLWTDLVWKMLPPACTPCH